MLLLVNGADLAGFSTRSSSLFSFDCILSLPNKAGQLGHFDNCPWSNVWPWVYVSPWSNVWPWTNVRLRANVGIWAQRSSTLTAAHGPLSGHGSMSVHGPMSDHGPMSASKSTPEFKATSVFPAEPFLTIPMVENGHGSRSVHGWKWPWTNARLQVNVGF